MMHLAPVTGENLAAVLALRVAPEQQRHIETTEECLGEATTSPRWRPMALYEEEALVGFAMYGAFPRWIGEGGEEQVWMDRLLIDQRYQGRGYGETALRLLLERLIAEYAPRWIYLSVYGDNAAAIALYRRYGFYFTGELDTKGELVMRSAASLPLVTYAGITEESRAQACAFLLARWSTTCMVLRGEAHDLAPLPGIVSLDDAGQIVGLIMYRVYGDTGEIMLLDAAIEGRGIGTTLLHQAMDRMRALGAARACLITTNDNLAALGLYQRHGFDLVKLYHGSMEAVRRFKPDLPLIGENGIPLRHELELMRDL